MAGPRIIIFGGRGKNNVFYKDIHAFDPVSLTWYQGPEGTGSPTERYGHSAGLVMGSKMIVFGGTNQKSYFNDINVLNLETMAWSKPETKGPAPSPRYSHASVVIKNTILIQGGFSFDESIFQDKEKIGSSLKSCYLNDIRLLQTEKMLWVRLAVSGSPPLSRFGHTLNISGSNIFMFGGWSIESNNKEDEDITQHKEIEYVKNLNVDKLMWEGSNLKKRLPKCRYGHSATTIGPHILIFGGWEYNRATSDVVILRYINNS